MSNLAITLDYMVYLEVQKAGFYPYPHVIEVFKAIFTNTATKEQIDQADVWMKPKPIRRSIAKSYDRVQEYVAPTKTKSPSKERK